MSAATKERVDAFVEEARLVTVGEAADRLGVAGLKQATRGERVGPCPACGGTDRFSINAGKGNGKGAWNCRGAVGGQDGIGLAAHLCGIDVADREGFLAACAAALGRPVPDGEDESDAAKARRAAALAARQARAEDKRAKDEAATNAFREKERAKARGKWSNAPAGDGPHLVYLAGRLGVARLPALPLLRTIRGEAYYHGRDAGGRALTLYDGPAMVAPFIDADGAVIGCHLTWLAHAGPMGWPDGDVPQGRLPAQKGRPIMIDPATGARLPTKKMRGTKKGGLIPLIGWRETGAGPNRRIVADPARTRLVIGEGVENVLAIGVVEGFPRDTLYAAAGDLGNLAGPADPKSAFGHPVLKDASGKRPLRVQGPVPRPDASATDGCFVPPGITAILLVGDGDSEAYATAAAMLRAQARMRAAVGEGAGESLVAIDVAMPPPGTDFCDLLVGVGVRGEDGSNDRRAA